MSTIARNKPTGGYAEGTVKYPRLPAHVVGARDREQLVVWCCWCDAWHYHGAGIKGDSEYPAYGHRVAHCHTDSPYKQTGYVLTDPKTLERKR